jgi:hypothetical protein
MNDLNNCNSWGQIFSLFKSERMLNPDWSKGLFQTKMKIEKSRIGGQAPTFFFEAGCFTK